MRNKGKYKVGTSREAINLHDVLSAGKNLKLNKRLKIFSEMIIGLKNKHQFNYLREVLSSADREIEIWDSYKNKSRKMLMFGSNNYLGLANHPYVCEYVKKVIDKYGVGVGGPPLLNGYTRLTRELEVRLSAIKHCEDTMLFSSGYNTNIGLVNGLLNAHDTLIYDSCSHASLVDGIKLAKINGVKFEHNNLKQLDDVLKTSNKNGDKFVGVEGVYSMSGDVAPLDEIVPVCKRNNALLIVDDAHGTGVMGSNGYGTSEYFNVCEDIDINMGTFSKTFAVNGGFLSSSKPIIEYLRFFSRSYMFSAAIPPIITASVLAGLDVIDREPERRNALHNNVTYIVQRLKKFGLVNSPKAGIVAIPVPVNIDIREASRIFHDEGIFLNAIEYPAVPIDKQLFRVSIMATHTKQDLDKLVNSFEEVWGRLANEDES